MVGLSSVLRSVTVLGSEFGGFESNSNPHLQNLTIWSGNRWVKPWPAVSRDEMTLLARRHLTVHALGGTIVGQFPFLLQPSASVPDLPQAPSTSCDPSRRSSSFVKLLRPSNSRDFIDFVLFDIPRDSTDFPDRLRPSISSDSFDFFSRLLRPFTHFSDLTRAYLNSLYVLPPFIIFEFTGFRSSTSFDGSVSAQGSSNCVRCASGCSVSSTFGPEGQKGR
jgi:hypothetical protein